MSLLIQMYEYFITLSDEEKTKKLRAKKYEPKLALKGTLDEVLKSIVIAKDKNK